jgi:hypothetical protein
MAGLGLPGFNADGTLDARPLGGPSMGDLTDRYSTLGGTLTAFYAMQTGQPLPEFVASNASGLSSMVGSSVPAGSSASLASLQDQLKSDGVNPLVSATSAQDYARLLSATSTSVDSQVGLAGLSWAQQLASFRGGSGKLGPEALAFSAVLSSTLSSMVGQFPDLYAQVRSSGLSSPAAQQAWRSSMLQATSRSGGSLSAMLPSQCYGTMLTAMASGSPSAAGRIGGGSGCGACLSTGLYLNQQLSSLFNPAATSTIPNTADKVLPPAEWNAMPAWQKNIVLQQNPSLATQAASAPSTLGGCSGGSQAASKAVSATLPNVFANLNKK